MRTPYDWELERARRRWYDKVAAWAGYMGALALAPIGLYLLIVGRPAGWVVLVLAAAIWATGWALDRGEP